MQSHPSSHYTYVRTTPRTDASYRLMVHGPLKSLDAKPGLLGLLFGRRHNRP